MVISIVANLYQTDNCNQIPPLNMPDTGNAKDCLELPPTNFFDFYIKNRDLISFTVQYCFLFRFVCIELVSLIWFLQIWVAIYDQLVHFDKEITANVYHHSLSWSILNVSTVHLNGIWHLIWRYMSKPVLGGHHSIARGSLNTGFTLCNSSGSLLCSLWCNSRLTVHLVCGALAEWRPQLQCEWQKSNRFR